MLTDFLNKTALFPSQTAHTEQSGTFCILAFTVLTHCRAKAFTECAGKGGRAS